MKARHGWPFLSGGLMGLGLSLSGMITPDRVQDLFDVSGRFAPNVLIALAVALLVARVGYRRLEARSKPWHADRFEWPRERVRLWRLVLGSIMVGLGLGFTGYAPSAAIFKLASFAPDALVFVVAMLGGHLAYWRWAPKH